MEEAHRVAAQDLVAPEFDIWLQVNESNEAAVDLYLKMGYAVKSRETDAKEVVRGALSYSFQSTTRLCLSKTLERLAEND
jgi:hypothetical protein